MDRPTTNKPYTLIALRHSGTHLIQPLIRSLTGKTVFAPKGDTALTCEPSAKVVVWLRDPRNTLVSAYRYKNGKDAPADDARFAHFLVRQKNGVTPVRHMTQWAERWGQWPGAHVARFEDFAGADAMGRMVNVAALAEYLLGQEATGEGMPRLKAVSDAIAYAFGTSGTYTGRHSRWPEWFGPLSTAAFNGGGGERLLGVMGYK